MASAKMLCAMSNQDLLARISTLTFNCKKFSPSKQKSVQAVACEVESARCKEDGHVYVSTSLCII